MTLSIAITYGLLTLSLAALWLPCDRTIYGWQTLCAAAIGCGLWFDFIQPLGVLPIIILGVACHLMTRKNLPSMVRIISGVIVMVMSLGLSSHTVPGFSNPKVIADVIFSEGGVAYTKYLNFDKAIVGLFLLGLTIDNLLGPRRAWLSMLRKAAAIAGPTILVLTILSLAMGYIRFDPKWSSLFGIWAWSNLFFTCMAEEALFRGLIQRHLADGLRNYPYGSALAIVVSAVAFGVAHYQGGAIYVLLATIAGIGYGWSCHHSKCIEAAILTHFSLNLVHFLFFTYPALESVF